MSEEFRSLSGPLRGDDTLGSYAGPMQGQTHAGCIYFCFNLQEPNSKFIPTWNYFLSTILLHSLVHEQRSQPSTLRLLESNLPDPLDQEALCNCKQSSPKMAVCRMVMPMQ